MKTHTRARARAHTHTHTHTLATWTRTSIQTSADQEQCPVLLRQPVVAFACADTTMIELEQAIVD